MHYLMVILYRSLKMKSFTKFRNSISDESFNAIHWSSILLGIDKVMRGVYSYSFRHCETRL